ncbi:glycosyltransferase family 2 protein [Nibricoccus sp. IMCC34717]|uniref:glycosyltransferase family 2 protein n=1 Tax=Nibricoccus sp. IMCC34717 TaxID=3034021 RepID=UPI0038517CE2
MPPGAPAPSGSVALSLIVPTYNCLRHTEAFWQSVQSTLAHRSDWELLFVDDGSTDGSREWLQSLHDPRVRVRLNPRNLGYAAANNAAVAEASGNILLLLNNDLVLQRDWLEPMLAALESAQVGIVGNVQRSVATGEIDHAGIEIDAKGRPTHVRHLDPWAPATARWPAVTGACCALRRDVWSALGGFDEGYRNGGEDVDLCFRLAERHLSSVVANRSVVLHRVSASPGRKANDEANSCRLARRWHARLAHEGVFNRSLQITDLELDAARTFADPAEALHLAAFRLGLVRLAPASATRAVEQAMRLDEERWRRQGL